MVRLRIGQTPNATLGELPHLFSPTTLIPLNRR